MTISKLSTKHTIDTLYKYTEDTNMAEQYLADGWKQISLDILQLRRLHNMINWCEGNCNNKFFQADQYFLFENQRDANYFTLRWL